ncbi:MAG: hypothetical protein A2277_20235 [Desulfobacterales bacterium RIFOXYA12_FULL_46_15]|nr:MAG: hypothetical protein A2277_20235 [Desulfobacterales bacterium RIFOXYA12_FULL_46_15]
MKKQLVIFAMFLCSWIIFANPLYAIEIQFAVDEANPPFMYKNSTTGKAAGLYPELVQAIFKEFGAEAVVNPFPWKRVLTLGESGETGIAGIYKNEKRLLIFDYSKPIFDEKIVIYTHKDKRFAYNGIADLKGKSIGVIRGWSYGDDFDKGKEKGDFSIQENVSDELNFKKLEADRVDCVLAIQQSGDSVIEKLSLQDKVVMLEQPMIVNSTYIVFAKKSNQLELIKKFNDTLDRMNQDGSYQAKVKEIFEEEAKK